MPVPSSLTSNIQQRLIEREMQSHAWLAAHPARGPQPFFLTAQPQESGQDVSPCFIISRDSGGRGRLALAGFDPKNGEVRAHIQNSPRSMKTAVNVNKGGREYLDLLPKTCVFSH